MPDKHRPGRVAKLLPDGEPKWVRVYEQDPGSAEQYVVVYSGAYDKPDGKHWYVFLRCDGTFRSGSQLGTLDGGGVQMGCNHPRLGKRIRFENLPVNCQKVVISDYTCLWDLPEPSKRSEQLARVAAAEYNEECNLGMHE